MVRNGTALPGWIQGVGSIVPTPRADNAPIKQVSDLPLGIRMATMEGRYEGWI